MEIKKELENYNNYLAEIKTIEYKIKKLEKEEVAISGSNFEVNGDIKGKGYKASNTENKIIKNVDKIELLKKRKEEIQAKIDMLDSYINILDDYHRRILELKYKYNKSSAQIGTILYRTKRTINKELKISLETLEGKFKRIPEKYPLSSH